MGLGRARARLTAYHQFDLRRDPQSLRGLARIEVPKRSPPIGVAHLFGKLIRKAASILPPAARGW